MIKRMLLLVAGLLLVPACGSDSSSGPQPTPAQGGAGGSAGQGGGGGSGGPVGGSAGTAGKGGKGGSAGTAGAAGKAGSAGAPADPCGGVPPKGVCEGTSQVKYCSTPTGQSKPQVITVDCKTLEECRVEGGVAKCFPKPGLCEPGKSECVDAQNARQCNESGQWDPFACENCELSAMGVTCTPSGSTDTWTGALSYEARIPNAQYTDWSTDLQQYIASAMLVMSMQYDSATQQYTPVDSVISDGQGQFTIKLPSSPGPDDILAVFPAYVEASTNKILFAIIEPDVPDGEYSLDNGVPAAKQYWYWAWKISELGASPGNLLITEANGSGVAAIFDALRFSHLATSEITGKTGKSVAVWMRYNTSFSCGACFADVPATAMSDSFDSQVFFSTTTLDQGYWSFAVSCHEFGHWAMAAYGVSPGEGGPHVLGCSTYPGMAWSEGWATWFAVAATGNTKYYDKQQGTFFYLDVASRASVGDWPRPVASDGLLQKLYELEVSTMMWKLTDPGSGQDSPLGLASNKVFFDSLQATRMTQSPFARGYTRHVWELGQGCDLVNAQDTGESAPMFADYLDALRCAGMDAAKVDQATEPQTYYPYPSESPICQ